MAVGLTPRAAARDIERAAKARQRSAAEAAEDQTKLFEAIRIGLEVGVTVSEIARITGLTNARIYQIRDGRR